jgi:hypothetical protein
MNERLQAPARSVSASCPTVRAAHTTCLPVLCRANAAPSVQEALLQPRATQCFGYSALL